VIGLSLLVLAALAPTPPAPVDREAAREAAARELSKGIYHAHEPGLFERLADRIMSWLDARLTDAANAAPGGAVGVLAIVLAIAVLIAVLVWRIGPLRRSAARAADIELSGPLDAQEHRRRAQAYAAEGRYAEAVRERMRAVVRELETRGVLDPRPGRTADEVALDAGALVPAVAGELRAAAHVFDEVWFGGRPAGPAEDNALREVDDRVRTTSLVISPNSAAGYRAPG
jgi:Domain of unknown function (DUF4129)